MLSSQSAEINLLDANGVQLNVVTDLRKILDTEVNRVSKYLRVYPNYAKMGYAKFMRWPDGIDPEKGYESQASKIRSSISQEIEQNRKMYEDFGDKQKSAFRDMKHANFDRLASELFGYKVSGQFVLYPTAYGTMSSPFNPLLAEPAFFRLSEFRQPIATTTGKDRTTIERLTHELYAHSLTAIYRSGTMIDDYLNKGLFVDHKERLMDLIGRTLLVRSGLKQREDVAMQIRGVGVDADVANVVDGVYYAGSDQSENNLRYEGNIGELIGEVVQAVSITKLK